MKRALTLSILLAVLLVQSAGATTNDVRLDAVASRFAQRPVTVDCYTSGEPGDPETQGAWGYVFLWDDKENMAAEVCAGALAIADHSDAVPLWEQALGALVLTHESYHLRFSLANRGSEGATECRAIRHFRYTVQFLGGTPELATTLLPFALALHWRIAALAPEYNRAGCVVPNWWH